MASLSAFNLQDQVDLSASQSLSHGSPPGMLSRESSHGTNQAHSSCLLVTALTHTHTLRMPIMAAHSHLWPQEIQTTEMYLGSEAVTWLSAANH